MSERSVCGAQLKHGHWDTAASQACKKQREYLVRASLRGMRDLLTPALEQGVVRRSGGGRKRVTVGDTTLLADLDALIEPTKRGDPMRGLRWTCKSTRQLAKSLVAKGHTVSHTTVADELHLCIQSQG